MPATAGRVRMPANNRVHSSAALQTHGIWQSAIGYDPYAPNKEDSNPSEQKISNSDTGGAENAYASFQGLLALARITGSNADEIRGACKKCFRVGHLTYQCRNFLSVKEDGKDKDPDEINATVLASIDKLKGNLRSSNGKIAAHSSEESSEEDESESSDSDDDSEMERIIAERRGKKMCSRRQFLGSVASDDDKCGSRKKRERSRTRRNRDRKDRDSDDYRIKRTENRRRRRRDVSTSDDGDDDDSHHRRARKSRKDKRRRRSHRRSDDSSVVKDSRHGKRKNRRPVESSVDSSEGTSSEDSRVGRSKKRSVKKSHRRHHEYED